MESFFCDPRGPYVYLLVSIYHTGSQLLNRRQLSSSTADCELLKGARLPVPTTEVDIIVQSTFWLASYLANFTETGYQLN